MVQDFGPTAYLGEHLDFPSPERMIQEETSRQLAVGIVLGKNEDVRLIPVDAHGSTSPRINAPTRSPFIWNSLTGRTTVGSRWLFL